MLKPTRPTTAPAGKASSSATANSYSSSARPTTTRPQRPSTSQVKSSSSASPRNKTSPSTSSRNNSPIRNNHRVTSSISAAVADETTGQEFTNPQALQSPALPFPFCLPQSCETRLDHAAKLYNSKLNVRHPRVVDGNWLHRQGQGGKKQSSSSARSQSAKHKNHNRRKNNNNQEEADPDLEQQQSSPTRSDNNNNSHHHLSPQNTEDEWIPTNSARSPIMSPQRRKALDKLLTVEASNRREAADRLAAEVSEKREARKAEEAKRDEEERRNLELMKEEFEHQMAEEIAERTAQARAERKKRRLEAAKRQMLSDVHRLINSEAKGRHDIDSGEHHAWREFKRQQREESSKILSLEALRAAEHRLAYYHWEMERDAKYAEDVDNLVVEEFGLRKDICAEERNDYSDLKTSTFHEMLLQAQQKERVRFCREADEERENIESNRSSEVDFIMSADDEDETPENPRPIYNSAFHRPVVMRRLSIVKKPNNNNNNNTLMNDVIENENENEEGHDDDEEKTTEQQQEEEHQYNKDLVERLYETMKIILITERKIREEKARQRKELEDEEENARLNGVMQLEAQIFSSVIFIESETSLRCISWSEQLAAFSATLFVEYEDFLRCVLSSEQLDAFEIQKQQKLFADQLFELQLFEAARRYGMDSKSDRMLVTDRSEDHKEKSGLFSVNLHLDDESNSINFGLDVGSKTVGIEQEFTNELECILQQEVHERELRFEEKREQDARVTEIENQQELERIVELEDLFFREAIEIEESDEKKTLLRENEEMIEEIKNLEEQEIDTPPPETGDEEIDVPGVEDYKKTEEELKEEQQEQEKNDAEKEITEHAPDYGDEEIDVPTNNNNNNNENENNKAVEEENADKTTTKLRVSDSDTSSSSSSDTHERTLTLAKSSRSNVNELKKKNDIDLSASDHDNDNNNDQELDISEAPNNNNAPAELDISEKPADISSEPQMDVTEDSTQQASQKSFSVAEINKTNNNENQVKDEFDLEDSNLKNNNNNNNNKAPFTPPPQPLEENSFSLTEKKEDENDRKDDPLAMLSPESTSAGMQNNERTPSNRVGKQRIDKGAAARLDALDHAFGGKFDENQFYEIYFSGAGSGHLRLTCGANYDVAESEILTSRTFSGHESQVFSIRKRDDGFIYIFPATAKDKLALGLENPNSNVIRLQKFDPNSDLQCFEFFPNNEDAFLLDKDKKEEDNSSFSINNNNQSNNNDGTCNISHKLRLDHFLEESSLGDMDFGASPGSGSFQADDGRVLLLPADDASTYAKLNMIAVSKDAEQFYNPSNYDDATAERKKIREEILLGDIQSSGCFSLQPSIQSDFLTAEHLQQLAQLREEKAEKLKNQKEEEDEENNEEAIKAINKKISLLQPKINGSAADKTVRMILPELLPTPPPPSSSSTSRRGRTSRIAPTSSSSGAPSPPVLQFAERFTFVDAGDGFVRISWWADSNLSLTAPLEKNQPFFLSDGRDVSSSRQKFAMKTTIRSFSKDEGATAPSSSSASASDGAFILQPMSHPGMSVHIGKDLTTKSDDDVDSDNDNDEEAEEVAVSPEGKKFLELFLSANSSKSECQFIIQPIETGVSQGQVTLSSRMKRDLQKQDRNSSMNTLLSSFASSSVNQILESGSFFELLPHDVLRNFRDGASESYMRFALHHSPADPVNNKKEQVLFSVQESDPSIENISSAEKFVLLPIFGGGGYFCICPFFSPSSLSSLSLVEKLQQQRKCLAIDYFDGREYDTDGNLDGEEEVTWSIVDFKQEDTIAGAQWEAVALDMRDENGDKDGDAESTCSYILKSRRYPNMALEPQLDQADDEVIFIKPVRIDKEEASSFCYIDVNLVEKKQEEETKKEEKEEEEKYNDEDLEELSDEDGEDDNDEAHHEENAEEAAEYEENAEAHEEVAEQDNDDGGAYEELDEEL